MHAVLQEICGGRGLIIRVGPECRAWGDPFQWAVTGEITAPGEIYLHALAPEEHGDTLRRAHGEAIIRLLRAAGFPRPEWERRKPDRSYHVTAGGRA